MVKLKEAMVVSMVIFAAIPVIYARAEDSSADHFTSQAASWRQERRERIKERIQEIYSELNLTDAQKEQLKANKTKHREQRKAGFEKMRSYKETLKQELVKPDMDKKRIKEIQDQLKAAQAQIADDRLDSILEVRAILTPEQFTKFMTLMEQHRMKGSRFQNEQNGEAAPATDSTGK